MDEKLRNAIDCIERLPHLSEWAQTQLQTVINAARDKEEAMNRAAYYCVELGKAKESYTGELADVARLRDAALDNQGELAQANNQLEAEIKKLKALVAKGPKFWPGEAVEAFNKGQSNKWERTHLYHAQLNDDGEWAYEVGFGWKDEDQLRPAAPNYWNEKDGVVLVGKLHVRLTDIETAYNVTRNGEAPEEPLCHVELVMTDGARIRLTKPPKAVLQLIAMLEETNEHI